MHVRLCVVERRVGRAEDLADRCRVGYEYRDPFAV